jgi:heat shock protein HslJ
MRQDAGIGAVARRRVRGAALGAAVAVTAVVLAACGSSAPSADSTTTTKAKPTASTTDPKAATTTTDPKATTTTDPSNVTELDGAFTSTSTEGYELVADTELTLTFDGDQLSVNAGCNTMGSAYTLEAGVLTWTGVPRATMMACSDDLMAQDTWITDLLTEGVEVEASDGGATLTLTSGDVVITLAGVASSPITGTTWTLDGTIANDAVSSLPAGVDAPTLTIDEDGTAAVFAGCNRGSTTVDVAESTLTFSPVAVTKMACSGAAAQVEAQVLAVLDGEVEYAIDGDVLSITSGTDGLMYRAS